MREQTNMSEEIQKLKEEIARLRAEKAELREIIEQHGIDHRRIMIPESDLLRLFGVKCDNGKIAKTTEAATVRCNYATFKANVLRAVFPIPRGNKNDWIGNKPIKHMTDFEFAIAKKLIETAVKACIEAKDELEGT